MGLRAASLKIFCFVFVASRCSDNVEKRILLNDPNLVQSQIQALQQDLLNMKTTLDAQISTTNAQQAEIDSLKRSTNQHTNQGTTYTVWGKRSCPIKNGTEMIYSGIAGGGAYNAPGNGANTLCLPHNPDPTPADFPTHYEEDHGINTGILYGAEYQYTYRNIAIDDDVPCAVCFAAHASSVIMIPAKTACPKGWKSEYFGVLTASCQYSGVVQHEYLCVDEDAEYLQEGTRQQNYNGRLFYPVRARCGSLPCPPYKQAQPISCVVCSK